MTRGAASSIVLALGLGISATASAQCGSTWSGSDGPVVTAVRGLGSFELEGQRTLVAGANIPSILGQYVYTRGDQGWTPLMPGGGTAVVVHPGGAGPEIYASTAHDVWMWKNGGAQQIATRRWVNPSYGGTPGWVYTLGGVYDTKALAVFNDGTGEKLFAGGTGPGTTFVWKHNDAYWWTPVGMFTGGPGVTSMVVFDDGTGPALYAAGSFTAVDGVPARHIAKFNGSTWSAVGPAGFDPGPSAKLVVHNGTLYANSWAWTGEFWFNMGRGSQLTPLQVLDLGNGPELFSISAQGLEKWSVCFWMPVDVGINAGAALMGATAFTDDGVAKVAIGGTFTSCGPVNLSNLAVWTPPMTADMNGDGGVNVIDLLDFLGAFEEGAAPADLDNGQGTGAKDGAVDVNDLLHFVGLFELGC